MGTTFAPLIATAQPSGMMGGGARPPNAAELLRAIERLAVVGNVLYVAAHPDDENTRLLSYLGGEHLLRTAYLSLTRGDGGQNLIGGEQGPLLGLIRTQELLAARRIDGAEQFFTRARDFGYSKSAAETMSIWNKDAVLSDVVWIIRRFRPDIIMTRFSTQGGDTHGHHTASAMLAAEAFRAAADPAQFPEQLKRPGVTTWQAQRLYWNRSQWGGKPAGELAALPKLDIGGYNPLLGLSYGELAADSRSMHKSQGFGSARSRGPSLEYFEALAPYANSPQNIFDGLDFSWRRVSGSGRLMQLLEQARRNFNPHRPADLVPLLFQIRAELLALPENPWKESKLAELHELIGACAGLYIEATASDFQVVPGGSLAVTAAAISRGEAPLRLRAIRLPGSAAFAAETALLKNVPWQIEKAVSVHPTSAISHPYWLAEPPGAGLYTVLDPSRIGLPENPPLTVEFLLGFGTEKDTFSLFRPLLYKWTDPVAGERYRAIETTPFVMVNLDTQVLMFPDGQPRPLLVHLTAGAANVSGTVRLELPPGFIAEPASGTFSIEKKGAEDELRFLLRPHKAATSLPGTLRVFAEINGERMSRGVLRIDYPHIPIQTLFPEAEVKLLGFELKKTQTRIGYIAGSGDDIPAALRRVGYEVTELDDEALVQKPLARFAAIVVGVRAYNTNPRMPFYYKRLMEYVAAGGNLIVQYNTNNRLSKLTTPIGPYPFEISQDRVTDENAPVTLTPPSHPLFHHPNRISAADFAGWVQERGLYFADKWSEKYETPLSMNDPGEPAKQGSLLLVRHGKGTFIYTGLAFFRQLPAGVPGAYRLFANMISYGQ